MLDYFKVRLPAGFPDHPHRGFETVTYMKSGKFYHEDFKGHKGIIGPGDIQWMTAGKGIVHSEMPGSFDEDSLGFQLWLNLKSTEKMKDPRYQEFTKDQVPLFEKEGSKVKIICGTWEGHTGPIIYNTPSIYMDVEMEKNGEFNIPINGNWNSIIFVYDGQISYTAQNAKHNVQKDHCLVLEKSTNGDIIHKVNASQGAKFVLIGGQPLNEPVVNYGPFVMNTNTQIQQTFIDYQTGKNGFEGADQWESKIQELSKGLKPEEL